MLAKAFGTSREVKEVESIIRRNKIQGHTDPKDNKWMFNNIGKYFHKVRQGESVEEMFSTRSLGLSGASKRSREKARAKEKEQKKSKNKEEVEEGIMGLNKWSAEYKAGKAAAKKGEKYDTNPHPPGDKKLNWSHGHNEWRADNLRKAGKPNYGARGQFEELEEGTWHIAKDMTKLKNTMKQPMPLGTGSFDFVAKYIGDDELWDDL